MVRQIAPLFFTMDIPATLAYYREKLGFECLGTWQDPPVYAIVARDRQVIHFRCAEPPAPNPDKYADELLDAYLFVDGRLVEFFLASCSDNPSQLIFTTHESSLLDLDLLRRYEIWFAEKDYEQATR